MPEKHTFAFEFPDGHIPDTAAQEQLLVDMQAIAARLGASVMLASVEELPREYDLAENKFTRQIQENLDYDMRADVRITQRTRNVMGGYGGFLTCRDVLVAGQNVFRDIQSFGENCLASMQTVLDDKVPQLPFLKDPDPSFTALFCKQVNQIHFGATGDWRAGYPSRRVTIGDIVTHSGQYSPEVVHDAQNYARQFRAARMAVIAQQRQSN